MMAVRQFDLNQNSLAEGKYDDCEKMLVGDDADEPQRAGDDAFNPQRELDRFLGKAPGGGDHVPPRGT